MLALVPSFQSSFGDSSVLLERYLKSPRHVEVQVIADEHGNVVHLHERDCSIQRRHQKVLEEAPAPRLDDDLRRRMGEAAVQAAKAVNYVGAGTVEFLMESGTSDFYFCEMNTRLQVEHPVTEMVTGIDLVEWQLRIAAGEELPVKDQDRIRATGHAIEARIYAENPARDFLPATGTLTHLSAPSGDGVRVDTGVSQGDDVSVYYDPMISKLVCYGETRDAAIDKLVSSLRRYQVAGMPTNIPFVEKCATHKVFRDGSATTAFLDLYADDVRISEGGPPSKTSRVIAALAVSLRDAEKYGSGGDGDRRRDPFTSSPGSWRLHGRASRLVNFLCCEKPARIVSNRDGSFDVTINEEATYESVRCDYDVESRKVTATIAGRRFDATAVIEDGREGDATVSLWSDDRGFEGDEYYAKVAVKGEEAGAGRSASQSDGVILSPMPGKIVAVNLNPGDDVSKGDVILIMEAMKMEHPIAANANGTVIAINASKGDLVQDGQRLVEIKPSSGSGEV